MDDILLHPLTKQVLEQVLQSPHHAIALVGPFGAGKGFLATKLTEELLGKQHKQHQIFRLGKDQVIGIEEIRGVHSFLRLKTPGHTTIRRIVIIEDAQNLTIEAQNALLKTLEEPPADTKIILTITDMNSLRKTVYSRLQVVHVQPCTNKQITAYFKAQGYTEEAIKKAYLISGGYVGLCSALLADDQHSLVAAIAEAKSFLSATMYERLTSVEKLAKDKEKAVLLLFATKRVLSAAARNSKDEQSIGAMAARLKTVYQAEHALQANPNMKLLLTDLALQL